MSKFLESIKRTDKSDEAYSSTSCTPTQHRMINGALGLAGEAGEVVDIIKKHVQYGKALDVALLKEELGDMLYYAGLLMLAVDTDFKEVMEMNTAKLLKRFPHGFDASRAINKGGQ